MDEIRLIIQKHLVSVWIRDNGGRFGDTEISTKWRQLKKKPDWFYVTCETTWETT